MIPNQLLLDYTERIEALDEHDRDRLLGLLDAMRALGDDDRVVAFYGALAEVAEAVADNGLPVTGSLLARVGEILAGMPGRVLDEELRTRAVMSAHMPATLMGKEPGIGTVQAVWQTVAQMVSVEHNDRETVLRNAKRGMGAEPEDGWSEGRPPRGPDDRDHEDIHHW